MDSETNIKWTEHTLKNGLKDDPAEKVLFADVAFQQAQNFHEASRDLNTVVYLLPENHTDKVQPIDAGYGKMIKKKNRQTDGEVAGEGGEPCIVA